MDSLERAFYVQGVGDEPAEQATLQEKLSGYGISLDPMPVDWRKDDYETRRDEILENIGTANNSQERVSMIGASGGGKAALDIFMRNPHKIHNVVLISTKISPYVMKPTTRETYPNLVNSSNALFESLAGINSSLLKKILCIHPLEDEVVNPVESNLEGADEIILPVNGHIAGIAYALNYCIEDIAKFIKRD